MIKSYALLVLADICHKLAVWSGKACDWLHKQNQKLLSQSYLAQGSGKGPWIDG